jgi:hypothetical protein
LEVTLKGTPHVDMDRFKTVVAEHLQRFGHRETLTFDWRDATARRGVNSRTEFPSNCIAAPPAP